MKICIRNRVESKDDLLPVSPIISFIEASPSFSEVCRSGLVNVSRTRLRNKLANGNRTRLVKYEFKKNEIMCEFRRRSEIDEERRTESGIPSIGKI